MRFNEYLNENIPSFIEYVNNSDEFKKVLTDFDINVEKMGKQKWGDTTRFSGKSAGIRIEKFNVSQKRKHKILDKLQKEYEKKYKVKVSFRDRLDFL